MNDSLTQHRTNRTLISIDPGKSTGVAIGTYSDTEPYKLVDVYQIPHGVDGFLDFMDERIFLDNPDVLDNELVWVSERFVLRSSNKFVADVEPLRIEGLLMALVRDPIHWQLRTDKMFVTDELLKKHNLWQTGKAFGWKDGRDANDAIVHALAFLRKQKHMPTLVNYWGEEV